MLVRIAVVAAAESITWFVGLEEFEGVGFV